MILNVFQQYFILGIFVTLLAILIIGWCSYEK